MNHGILPSRAAHLREQKKDAHGVHRSQNWQLDHAEATLTIWALHTRDRQTACPCPCSLMHAPKLAVQAALHQSDTEQPYIACTAGCMHNRLHAQEGARTKVAWRKAACTKAACTKGCMDKEIACTNAACTKRCMHKSYMHKMLHAQKVACAKTYLTHHYLSDVPMPDSQSISSQVSAVCIVYYMSRIPPTTQQHGQSWTAPAIQALHIHQTADVLVR